MANVIETATFDAGVYKIETTDPVQGGETGIANKGIKNLANRTLYLKQHVDDLETAQGGPQFLREGVVQLATDGTPEVSLDFDELDRLYAVTNTAGVGGVAIINLPSAALVPNGWPVAFAVNTDYQNQTTQIKAATGQNIVDVEGGVIAQTSNMKTGDYMYLFSNGVDGWYALARRVENVGEVSAFAKSDVPFGWLACNGAAVNRVTYGRLFSQIGTTFGVGNGTTTFNLPDLRGEFVRGYDNGRGVDTGRVFGSAQADELESHSHNLTPLLNTNYIPTAGIQTAMFNNAGTSAAGNVVNTGGTETRPRNIALLYCIKY